MKRMKVLGVTMLAVFAVSAIAASAAQAGEFHSEIEKTFLFGEQEGEWVFTTTAGNIKCKTVSYDSLNAQVGKGAGANWSVPTTTVRQLKSNCTAFGQSATIDNPPIQTASVCDLHYTGVTPPVADITITGTPVPAVGDAACETKGTVPSGNCSVVVNNQTPGTPSVTMTNTTFEGKKAIKATSGVKGVTYTVEGAAGSICGEPGTYSNGEIKGSAILRGYKSSTHTAAEQVGIWYE